MFPNARLAVVEHQTAHAASAYYASGFDEATVLTLDRSRRFPLRRAVSRLRATVCNSMPRCTIPDSLADLYSRVTELLGFHRGADEHKVQWLSTSGDDRFASPV